MPKDGSRQQPQMKRTKSQLDDAGDKFSAKLEAPQTERMPAKADVDTRKGNRAFDKPIDREARPSDVGTEKPGLRQQTQQREPLDAAAKFSAKPKAPTEQMPAKANIDTRKGGGAFDKPIDRARPSDVGTEKPGLRQQTQQREPLDAAAKFSAKPKAPTEQMSAKANIDTRKGGGAFDKPIDRARPSDVGTEKPGLRQQTQQREPLDAAAKFSAKPKAPTEQMPAKTDVDTRKGGGAFDKPIDRAARPSDMGTEKSGLRQQTQQRESLDAATKFSAKSKAPTEQMPTKADVDTRKDDASFDSAIDRTEAGIGDAIIANLDNTRVETPAVVKVTQEVPVAHDINSVAQQIATRVLVSPPGASNPEVRIQLKESVLQGSDVRIFRENGALKVVFVAPNQEAANFIANNREAMTATLNDRLPGEQVDISIETRQSERERGEHGEGRSRQQYVADDDDDISGVGR